MTLENERGNIIDLIGIYIGDVIELIESSLSEIELKKTFCLQFIDPYTDTTFNSFQKPVLVEEFKSLFDKSQSVEEKQKLKSIIEFFSKVQDEAHTYIKFYGD